MKLGFLLIAVAVVGCASKGNRGPTSQAIQGSTVISTLLDMKTSPQYHVAFGPFSPGFEITTAVTHPETKYEVPVIHKGARCQVLGSINTKASTYNVGDRYRISSMNFYPAGSPMAENSAGRYFLILKGMTNDVSELSITCDEAGELTFDDIAQDLGVVRFYN